MGWYLNDPIIRDTSRGASVLGGSHAGAFAIFCNKLKKEFC
jgi:hypothetical protein